MLELLDAEDLAGGLDGPRPLLPHQPDSVVGSHSQGIHQVAGDQHTGSAKTCNEFLLNDVYFLTS